MLRAIVAIIVSYIAVGIGIAVLFLGAMLILGLDGTFKPGEYWTTDAFNIVVLAGGTIVSLLGGMLCALLAGRWKPALVVAVIMLGLGLVSAIGNMNKPDPPAREAPAEASSDIERTIKLLEQTAQHGKEPVWFSFTTPIAGAAAFVAGAWVLKGRRTHS
jgi:hypothetical protein